MEIIYTLFKLFVLIQINQNQIIFPLKENIIIRKKKLNKNTTKNKELKKKNFLTINRKLQKDA